MKITEINIPEPKQGLKPIGMSRLGNVVLIAGKNGAGKTRILNEIFNTFNGKPGKSHILKIRTKIKNLSMNIISYQQQINQFKMQLKYTSDENQIHDFNNNIASYNRAIESWKKQIDDCNKQLNWNLIETDEQVDYYNSIPFVPTRLDLKDCNSLPKNEQIQRAKNVDNIGIGNLADGVFSRIQIVQDKWYESTHQYSQASQEEKEKAINDYEKLREILRVFLDTEITRTIDGDATLFGFPLGQSQLSDGQRVLLQLCIAIYSQDTALKDLILVMDEPENHLHPSVIIETIERIQKCVTNGQIWIATHSVALLSHFDSSSLWYVDNAKISYAGRAPENVLKSLLGNDEEIAKLLDFLNLPAQFATSKYAFECLFEPKPVTTNTNDPQVFQIKEELNSIITGDKIRILDYGAGKGRIISNLMDLDKQSNSELLSKIEYIAFDKYESDKEICLETLNKVFDSADKKYYNDFSKLFSDYNKNTFDVVIMCNVLHEIDPNYWLTLFKDDITELLKDNGILLLVEDCQMPIGEMAYQKGFLVLDTPDIKDLFSIEETDSGFKHTCHPENQRLKAHQIPKYLLSRINKDSREKAIKSVYKTAKDKIKEIRANNDKSYKDGLLHGFWTQELANARLCLDELCGGN